MWSKEMNIKIVRLSGTIIEPANKWGGSPFCNNFFALHNI